MPRKPLIDQLHREDSWRLFRILAEFVEGFEALAEIDVPLVSVFGSARFGGATPPTPWATAPDTPEEVVGGPEGGILKGMRVVLATSNPGKVRELKAGLEPLGWTLLSLADFLLRMPKEEGSTFLENALLKAAYAARATGLPALADDSGLEVFALGGEPGVYSARYGGRETDRERNVYLLERMRHLKGEERRARFVAVLVLAYPDGHAEAYEGSVEGVILEAPRGEGGFGYDPLFFIPEAGKTFAEMSLEEKARYSHRGRALQALLKAYEKGPPPREISRLE